MANVDVVRNNAAEVNVGQLGVTVVEEPPAESDADLSRQEQLELSEFLSRASSRASRSPAIDGPATEAPIDGDVPTYTSHDDSILLHGHPTATTQ